jgi:hypothetical protein
MTTKKKAKSHPTTVVPEWVTTAEMSAILGVSKEQLKTWRLGDRAKNPARGRKKAPLLTEGVHWVAYSSRKILFHRELMRDFLANIGRPSLHKKRWWRT